MKNTACSRHADIFYCRRLWRSFSSYHDQCRTNWDKFSTVEGIDNTTAEPDAIDMHMSNVEETNDDIFGSQHHHKAPTVFFGYAEERPVKIIVGTDLPATFHIHPGLLKTKSMFFRKMVSEDPAGGNVEIYLPDHDQDHPRHFVTWLYTATVYGDPDSAELIKVWQFGNTLRCEGFQNICIDRLRERQSAHDKMSAELVLSASREASKKDWSCLEEYCIDQAACDILDEAKWDAFVDSNAWDELSAGVVRQLVTQHKLADRRARSGRPFRNPSLSRACRYHVHEDSSTERCPQHKKPYPQTPKKQQPSRDGVAPDGATTSTSTSLSRSGLSQLTPAPEESRS